MALQKGIDRAKSALEEIAAASEQFQTVIREQDSAAYDELSRLWEEKVQKEERELAGKLGCIAEMVQGYIWDMTAYVEPENEGEMMRVDRNDIWQDYKKFYMYNPFLSAAENAGRKAALEEEEREERERRERNYNTLAEFRKTLMGKITDELPGHIKKIHAIYEKNIVPFENTDDAYKKQIAEYYDQWASIGNKAEDVGNIAVDILSGVVDGLKDMVTGIAGLLEGACKLVEWGGRKLTGLTVPEELDEDVSNIFLCAETIIKDPGNALEAMGQHMFDVADEKGLAYSVSYVTADVVAGILLDKGIGKLKELRKAKKLNKIDDVLDTAEDLTGVGNNGTSLVDDVVESGLNSVDDIIKGVENGDVPLINNIQKGNYGEMKMDAYFESQGYERISLDRVTDLNTPTHQGIDGVYYNPDGHPPYIIGEAKYGSSRLSTLADGTPQMSDKWIIDRLENTVGEEVANDIKMEMILNPDNVGSSLVHVSPDGGIDITELIDGIKQ